MPEPFLKNIWCSTQRLLLAGCFISAAGAGQASAGDFDIVIDVRSGDEQFQSSQTNETPSAKPPQPRIVVPLTHDMPIHVAWRAQNTDQTRECKNVLVHFFVVKEKKAGQTTVPKLTRDVAYEGALTMDFKPREKATWNFNLAIHEPGDYLLRVETIGLSEQHQHEYFAALDLTVK